MLKVLKLSKSFETETLKRYFIQASPQQIKNHKKRDGREFWAEIYLTLK